MITYQIGAIIVVEMQDGSVRYLALRETYQIYGPKLLYQSLFEAIRDEVGFHANDQDDHWKVRIHYPRAKQLAHSVPISWQDTRSSLPFK